MSWIIPQLFAWCKNKQCSACNDNGTHVCPIAHICTLSPGCLQSTIMVIETFYDQSIISLQWAFVLQREQTSLDEIVRSLTTDEFHILSNNPLGFRPAISKGINVQITGMWQVWCNYTAEKYLINITWQRQPNYKTCSLFTAYCAILFCYNGTEKHIFFKVKPIWD